jgi:hypothetical protein
LLPAPLPPQLTNAHVPYDTGVLIGGFLDPCLWNDDGPKHQGCTSFLVGVVVSSNLDFPLFFSIHAWCICSIGLHGRRAS